ncbi:hypothetical protein NKG05_07865 [Oerskovia sp. M15]
MIVWTICGVTAVVAAVVLAFVPRLAFADGEPVAPQEAPVAKEALQ